MLKHKFIIYRTQNDGLPPDHMTTKRQQTTNCQMKNFIIVKIVSFSTIGFRFYNKNLDYKLFNGNWFTI